MKIMIETIPHDQQRYNTCGDWTYLAPPFVKEGDVGIMIRVSQLSDWRREALVAIHELVEVLLCRHAGVSQHAVDEFDMEYEKTRPYGDVSEPGDDSNAPYNRQHCMATGIERILASQLSIDWAHYEQELETLP